MLAVQGGNLLAGIELGWIQGWDLELDTEQIAGTGTQWLALGGQNGATEHHIDFDFHLAYGIFSNQLGAAQILAADQARLNAKRFQPLRDRGQFLVSRVSSSRRVSA